MTTNSQIILNGVLKHHQSEIDPQASADGFFEFFTAEQAKNIKDFDLSYDELESGLVGDGGDGGIDGIYLMVNGDLVQEDSDYTNLRKDIVIDLVILQSKTHSGFQETPIERFITVSRHLFDLSNEDSLPSSYNTRLLEAMHRFHNLYRNLAAFFPTFNVTFYYASKGEDPSASVKLKVDILRNVASVVHPKRQLRLSILGRA